MKLYILKEHGLDFFIFFAVKYMRDLCNFKKDR